MGIIGGLLCGLGGGILTWVLMSSVSWAFGPLSGSDWLIVALVVLLMSAKR